MERKGFSREGIEEKAYLAFSLHLASAASSKAWPWAVKLTTLPSFLAACAQTMAGRLFAWGATKPSPERFQMTSLATHASAEAGVTAGTT